MVSYPHGVTVGTERLNEYPVMTPISLGLAISRGKALLQDRDEGAFNDIIMPEDPSEFR